MRIRNERYLFVYQLCLLCALALGARSPADPLLGVEEFGKFAGVIAPRVNLFRDVWEKSPDVEFFGGTSRDFLYWLKRELLKGAHTRLDVEKNMAKLLSMPTIDVRDFIVGESDVDLVSRSGPVAIDPARYGVRKLDYVDVERLDPDHPMGRTERDQGFIPVEKIRISKNGIIRWTERRGSGGSFPGDGVREILEGQLTVHFSPREVFESTHYAKLGLNHPVLLALRYLRLVAMHYYYEHGRGYPDLKALQRIMAPGAADDVKATLKSAISDKRFTALLKNPSFVEKANQTIEKAFRSYTNLTAAHELYKSLGAKDLVAAYGEPLKPINQFLFAKHRDPAVITAHLEQYHIVPGKFFQPVETAFPGGKLHHGTKTEESFRDILFGGILPSTGGSAGAGLYGVASDNVALCTEYAGGDPDKIVVFNVSPSAKIVNVREGEGARVFREWTRKHGGGWDEFAEYFGIDILDYPYSSHAYVVKNSAVLERPQGYRRQLMSFGRMLEVAEETKTEADFERLLKAVELNRLNEVEQKELFKRAPYFTEAVARLGEKLHNRSFLASLKQGAIGNHLVAQPSLLPELLGWAVNDREDFERLFDACQIYFPAKVAGFLSGHRAGPRAVLESIVSDLLSHPEWPNAARLAELVIDKAESLHAGGALEAVGATLSRFRRRDEVSALIARYIEAVVNVRRIQHSSRADRDPFPSLEKIARTWIGIDPAFVPRIFAEALETHDGKAVGALVRPENLTRPEIVEAFLKGAHSAPAVTAISLLENWPKDEDSPAHGLKDLVAALADHSDVKVTDAIVKRLSHEPPSHPARLYYISFVEHARDTETDPHKRVKKAIQALEAGGGSKPEAFGSLGAAPKLSAALRAYVEGSPKANLPLALLALSKLVEVEHADADGKAALKAILARVSEIRRLDGVAAAIRLFTKGDAERKALVTELVKDAAKRATLLGPLPVRTTPHGAMPGAVPGPGPAFPIIPPKTSGSGTCRTVLTAFTVSSLVGGFATFVGWGIYQMNAMTEAKSQACVEAGGNYSNGACTCPDGTTLPPDTPREPGACVAYMRSQASKNIEALLKYIESREKLAKQLAPLKEKLAELDKRVGELANGESSAEELKAIKEKIGDIGKQTNVIENGKALDQVAPGGL